MKVSNNKNKVYFFMTLMILAGCFSCEKYEHQGLNKAEVKVTPSEVKGGDDEEEAIIQGIVQDEDSAVVIGATVTIFRATTSVLVDTASTDGNGQFQMRVPFGNYYFEVLEGSEVTTTDDFTLKGNSNIRITL